MVRSRGKSKAQQASRSTPFAMGSLDEAHEKEHIGVIVEKSGGEDSAKRKLLYLYTPTVTRGSGRLVCSEEWKKFNPGDCVKIRVDSQENFVSADPTENSRFFQAHLDTQTEAVVARVRVVRSPDFIKNNILNGHVKFWSPDVGCCFANVKGSRARSYPFDEIGYLTWVEYSTGPVNFCGRGDMTEVSEEPYGYWRIIANLPPRLGIPLSLSEEECRNILMDLYTASENSEELVSRWVVRETGKHVPVRSLTGPLHHLPMTFVTLPANPVQKSVFAGNDGGSLYASVTRSVELEPPLSNPSSNSSMRIDQALVDSFASLQSQLDPVTPSKADLVKNEYHNRSREDDYDPFELYLQSSSVPSVPSPFAMQDKFGFYKLVGSDYVPSSPSISSLRNKEGHINLPPTWANRNIHRYGKYRKDKSREEGNFRHQNQNINGKPTSNVQTSSANLKLSEFDFDDLMRHAMELPCPSDSSDDEWNCPGQQSKRLDEPQSVRHDQYPRPTKFKVPQ